MAYPISHLCATAGANDDMKETATHFVDDPGLFLLDILLRLRGLASDPDRIRRRFGDTSIGVPEMLAYAKEADLSARCSPTDWNQLLKQPLPGIAPLRGGSFLLLGKVKGDEAIGLAPGAERPTLISRTELESIWDGRLVLITKRHAIITRSLRQLRSWRLRALRSFSYVTGRYAALAPHISRVIKRLSSRPQQPVQNDGPANAVIVFADHARKLGRAVAKLGPSDQRRSADELAFLPAALEIVETPPSPVGRAIGLSIVAVFAVALAWACIGTVDIVSVAPGKLIPSGRTKTIQPFETSVVRAIYVQDGQTVTAGERLIDLDATMSAAELNHLKGDFQSAQLDVARLKAALAGTSDPVSAFDPPPEAPPSLVDMHRRFLVSQTAEQNAKVAAIDRQVTQKEAERATSNASIEKLKATLGPLQQRVDIREQLYQKELGSKLQYLTELQDLVGQRQEILVQQSKYGEADAAIGVLAETRTKTIAEYQRTLFEDLSKAEQKVAGLMQDVIKAERHTGLQNLTAPIDGVVQQLAVHTVGGVVTPAQTLMLIVPTDSNLEVEAMISNQDIGFVEPGQDAAIKVDTFNFTRYGLLRGKIVSVSQDAIPRNKPPENGNTPAAGAETNSSEPKGQELVYAARVSLERNQMDIDNRRVNLSAGMAVTTEIKSGSRRIISYILSPLMRYSQESFRER
jgi:hemolysin D